MVGTINLAFPGKTLPSRSFLVADPPSHGWEGEFRSTHSWYIMVTCGTSCLFDKVAYPRYHHSFRLRCDQADLVFTSDFEFHTLELPKFTPSSVNIGSLPAAEKWLYLLRHAESMDSDQLTTILVDPPFQEALARSTRNDLEESRRTSVLRRSPQVPP